MKWLIKFAPPLLIVIMVLISFFSARQDSAIMDEVAHIPAGYSYLKYQDYRLNPEHPPLAKMLAALPLLFMHLNFPLNHPAWTTEVNGQWETGYQFLYHLGNDADKILFWSRLPIIALLILLGIYVWKWSKELLGAKWASVVLFLYAFSPTIIAHSHYVTTDLAATCFIFIAFYYFVHYLKKPSPRNILSAGLALGLAEVAKFSAVLLFPCFFLLVLIPLFLNKSSQDSWLKQIKNHIGKFILICLIALGVILIVYQPAVWAFNLDKQQELIRGSIGPEKIEKIVLGISKIPGAEGLAQYILGVVMVFARVGGGNTNYFLGQVSNEGWWYYFPTCFLLKETIPVLILTGLALLFAIRKFVTNLVADRPRKWLPWFKEYMLGHLPEISMVTFIVIYGVVSMRGKLNLGIRHIMVLFPFIYILIIKKYKRRIEETKYKKTFIGILIAFLIWIGAEIVITYPSYLAYYNELLGGPKNGYKLITDSNLDWGQDLRRMAEWVNSRPDIQKIKVDYFGGGVPSYYLGDKFQEWHSQNGPTTGWIAVSANYFSESIYRKDSTFATSYYYLELRKPEKIFGHSIFVYYIPEK